MRNLQHLKKKRTRKPKGIQYKCTPKFAPRKVETMQCDNGHTLWDFKCTRLKLLRILRRHEKIASILKDVKHRIEPIQFMLTTAEEKSLLGSAAAKNVKFLIFEDHTDGELIRWDSNLDLCNLTFHNSELETPFSQMLQQNIDELKKLDLLGEESFAKELKQKTIGVQVDEDNIAWKTFLNDWNNMDEIKQMDLFAIELKQNETGEQSNPQLEIQFEEDALDKILRGLSNKDGRKKSFAADLMATRDNMGQLLDIEVQDDSQENVNNGDWKKILNELNDWCDQMDNTQTTETTETTEETSLLGDVGEASLFNKSSSNK